MEEEVKADKPNLIRSLGSIIPILTICIIILGLMEQLLFYYNWQVPVKYFIGISELGLLFSGDLIFIFISCLFVIIVSETRRQKQLIKLKNRKSSELPSEEVLDKKLRNLVLSMKVISVVMFIITIILIFTGQVYPKFLQLIALLILSVYIGYVGFNSDFVLDKLHAAINLSVLTAAVSCICYLFLYTSFEIRAVVKGKYKGTIITTADTSYVSTDSSYFIGKTEKYVFIYSTKGTTLILPTESVTKIIMKMQ